MAENDFLGSFAQENVLFSTRVVRTAAVGDIYYKVMIFVENSRFVDASEAAWAKVPGSAKAKALTVTSADYAEHTKGLLKSWLYDLFCSGFTGDCILVACGDVEANVTYEKVTSPTGSPKAQGYYTTADNVTYTLSTDETVQAGTTYYTKKETANPASYIEGMTEAYGLMRAYAYHKTVCAGGENALNPEIAVALAKLCADDKGLLSSAPLFPFTTDTPEDPESDLLYKALVDADVDAFMSAHQDASRNASLVSLGLALANYNGSGTPVGSGMEMFATGMITSSGPSGTGLVKGIRDTLANKNIQTWKPVGNNTGNVAAFGATTIKADTYSATWILAYVTYVIKVKVAQLMTEGEFLKNARNYGRIISVMNNTLSLFVSSGRLEDLNVTAPAFADLPESSGDEIVVPNAWSATYISNARRVTITGTLYIGA